VENQGRSHVPALDVEGNDWQARDIIQDKYDWPAQLSQSAVCPLSRDKLGSVDAHFRSREMMAVKTAITSLHFIAC
jgi:hypothetical protein